ncbi:MAG: rhodanese-like domain-containing protein [Chloroflexi bacterium]|nr:rhodanese-like domain-containing protein [Chloroflexota bacterium]
MIKSHYKNLVILALVVLLAIVVVYRSGGDCGEDCITESEALYQSIQDISVNDAFTMIETRASDPGFVILDIRTPEEFEPEHIEGAVNIDFYSEIFRDELDTLDKEKTYLIYCRTDRRTGESLSIMRELGFVEVYNMDGGINSWKTEGFPTIE